jgi:copper chaperone CopZ
MHFPPSLKPHKAAASQLWMLAIGAALFGGCSQCEVDIVHVDRAGSNEETVAQLAISGMMCEIACVSKVRKELYDVQGVARADIHFDDGFKVDTAFVAFDPSLVDAETLIATVQEIGDGLYAVESAEVVHYAPESQR